MCAIIATVSSASKSVSRLNDVRRSLVETSQDIGLATHIQRRHLQCFLRIFHPTLPNKPPRTLRRQVNPHSERERPHPLQRVWDAKRLYPLNVLTTNHTSHSNDLSKTPAEIYPRRQVPSQRHWAALGRIRDAQSLKDAPRNAAEDPSDKELGKCVGCVVYGCESCDHGQGYDDGPAVAEFLGDPAVDYQAYEFGSLSAVIEACLPWSGDLTPKSHHKSVFCRPTTISGRS